MEMTLHAYTSFLVISIIIVIIIGIAIIIIIIPSIPISYGATAHPQAMRLLLDLPMCCLCYCCYLCLGITPFCVWVHSEPSTVDRSAKNALIGQR